MSMDPFFEVQQDAQNQITNLEEFLKRTTAVTDETRSDFDNNISELQETIQDLKESIESSKADPEFFKLTSADISKRDDIVSRLERQYAQVQSQWTTRIKKSTNKTADGSNPFERYGEDAGAEDGHLDENQEYGAPGMNKLNELQQQEMIREQDQHLDGVYASMQTINQQARVMGTELEEQAYIIDEIDGEFDRIGNKLGRGMKRLEFIYEKNKERASDCCIGLLIIVLIVLLVLVIIL